MVVALDFSAAYDSVDRESLWKVLEAEGMGPRTLAVLRALGEGTESAVKVGGKLSSWFRVEEGVRQGSVLSPVLFGALMDWVLREALGPLSDRGVGLAVGEGDRMVDLDFADDVFLVASSLADVEEAVAAVETVGGRVGLRLNPGKTVWMADEAVVGDKLKVAGVDVQRSMALVYLGSEVDVGGGLAGEVARRVAAARRAFWGLRRLWKDRRVSRSVKLRVYAAVVRGALLYATETWPARVADVRSLEVFDRWCLRRVVGWTASWGLSNAGLVGMSGLPELVGVLVVGRMTVL